MTAADRALEMIGQKALCGERCPTTDQIPGGATSMKILTRNGTLRVEVSMHNFRQVFILKGEHAGKATADPAPLKDGRRPKPYMIIDASGRRGSGRYAHNSRPEGYAEPSRPRDIIGGASRR